MPSPILRKVPTSHKDHYVTKYPTHHTFITHKHSTSNLPPPHKDALSSHFPFQDESPHHTKITTSQTTPPITNSSQTFNLQLTNTPKICTFIPFPIPRRVPTSHKDHSHHKLSHMPPNHNPECPPPQSPPRAMYRDARRSVAEWKIAYPL